MCKSQSVNDLGLHHSSGSKGTEKLDLYYGNDSQPLEMDSNQINQFPSEPTVKPFTA